MKMNKMISVAIMSILLVSSILAGLTQPSVVHAELVEAQEPLNQIFLDVTYDPVSGTYSLAGLSAEQLRAQGVPTLTPELWSVLSKFDNVTFMLNNEEISVLTEGEKLASINWDEDSRRVLYDLASEYVSVTDSSKERIEEWAGFTNIIFNFRNSSEVSKPLQIELATLLRVDIESDRLLIEGFDTGMTLEPTISSVAETGGLENATACWYKGQLIAYANGKELPVITIHQEGLDVVNEALGLGLGYLPPYFDAQVGADVSFDGAEHSEIYCEK